MVAQFPKVPPVTAAELIKALWQFPQQWRLTPVNSKKAPYQKEWEKGKLDRTAIEAEIKSGRAKGYGLLTGPVGGGILAIDADGPAAHELLAKHGELPPTVAFTSGRPGRCQYLFRVSEDYREIVKTTKLNTGVKGEDGKDQLLEFRWDGCQSVLPPSVHPQTGRYQWVNSPELVPIAECPDWAIELILNSEEPPAAQSEGAPLLEHPVQPQVAVARSKDITVPVPASVPLEVCLAKSSRKLLSGVNSGSRNEAGAKLARDLIGTANYLISIGQAFDGDPQQMLFDFALRCSPPLPDREVRTICSSAERSNPTPACKADGVETCIKSWYSKNYAQQPSERATAGSNVLTHPRFTSFNSAELREAITALINAGTTGSELTAAIYNLAKGSNFQPIRRIYEEISEEIERADLRPDRKRDVENLLKISNRRLTLENYLHPSLAEPIEKVSTWMGVDPEAVLTHLLPVVAGLIDPNTRIVAKECINFVEPCLIYSGVIAPSGARKTPTLNIVKAPLVKLQSLEDERFERVCREYDAEVQAIKEAKKGNDSGGELPQKPKPPREYYLDNATVEAVDKVKGQQPDCGLTLIKDELSGLFASHGAYKGGKGADKESYLSGWNGGGVKKNRSGDGSRVSLARDSLSVTGSIQPDKLRALLGDFSDSQGEWARFLWYHMPMRPFKIPRDDTRYGLGDLLESLYKKIDALPALKLHFDKLGQTYFDDWHDLKDEQKRAETRPGLQAAIAKMPGQAVRLIGLLHVLWEVASGVAEVSEEIPLAVVKSGCKLADFYLGQVTILQSDGDAGDGELAPTMRKLLEKLAELKTLTARQAIQAIRDLRKTKPDKVRQLFVELKTMGLADTQGTGQRLVLLSKVLTNSEELQQTQKPCSTKVVENNTSQVLTSVGEVLTSKKDFTTVVESAFQEESDRSVDTVDRFETFDSIPPPTQASFPSDIPDSSSQNTKTGIANPTVNTPTDGAESLGLYGVKGVDTPSTLDVNTSKNANTPQVEPSASAESEQQAVPEPLAPPTAIPEPAAPPSAVPEPAKTKTFEMGDRVVVVGDNRVYRGATGRIVNVWVKLDSSGYEVEFDGPASGISSAEFVASELESIPAPPAPAPLQSGPLSETIGPADAEMMRDIARVWWSQYYPEQLQTLLTQMFGRGAPGTKYSSEMLARWLETEEETVRERLRELMRRRSEGPPSLP